MPEQPPLLSPFEQYLLTVDYMLVGLPHRRRDEICLELQAHLEDAAADQGRSPDDEQLQREVIDMLGPGLDLGVELHQAHYARYQTSRRVFDVVMATFLTLLMSPIFLVAALIIKLESPGPLFYKSEWLGQYGKRFMLYRLRTMTHTNDEAQKDFTRFGAWMRKVSLDEAAALINIFKGEVSFFGPRPLRPAETDLRNPRCRRILQVPPGISSPSLAHYGFPRVDLQKQLDIDEEYLDHRSLRYDFHLCWKTLRALHRQEQAARQ